MSQASVIFWPDTASNEATIAPLQVVGDDHIIKITSNLPNMPNVPVNNSGIYVYDHMLRTVRLTSVANLSGINISITGLSSPIDVDGNPLLSVMELFTETIPGPNAGSVETARIYQQINAITTDADTGVDEISVGFGVRGITAYIFLNLNSSAPMWAGYQGQPIDATINFDYQFYASMTKPETVNTIYGNIMPFPQQLPAFALLGAVQHNNNSVTTNINTQVQLPVIVWATINDTSVLPNSSFYFTVVQQGLTS